MRITHEQRSPGVPVARPASARAFDLEGRRGYQCQRFYRKLQRADCSPRVYAESSQLDPLADQLSVTVSEAKARGRMVATSSLDGRLKQGEVELGVRDRTRHRSELSPACPLELGDSRDLPIDGNPQAVLCGQHPAGGDHSPSTDRFVSPN